MLVRRLGAGALCSIAILTLVCARVSPDTGDKQLARVKGVVGYQTPAFAARGTQVTAPGGTLQFGLATTVPGGGYVTLCGYSRQYPLVAGNDAYHYLATVAPPIGFFAPLCRVDAYFVDSNGLTSVFTLNTPVSIDTRPKP